jgi:AcrR family transcriptional regulator
MIPKAQRRTPIKKGTSAATQQTRQGKKRAKAHVSNDRSSRRRPFQERARFTVAAILQAAAEVIDEVGWAHASTNRIAERAGVSIGSLYQYFANKEEILSTLMDEHRKDVHVVVGLALDRLEDPSVPIDDAFRNLFADLITMHRDDPVLTRVLATEVPHRHAGSHHGAKSDHLVRWLQRVLEQRPDVAVRDTMAAAHVVATSIEALTRWLVHEAPESVEPKAVVEEIIRMFSGYLSAPQTES